MVQESVKQTVRKVVHRLVAPVLERMGTVERRQDEMSAQLEQLAHAEQRLAAHLDRVREEVRADFGDLVDVAAGSRAVLRELVEPGDEARAGDALRERFDHALRHAEAQAADVRADVRRQLAEVRSSTRLTQALVERALVGQGPGPAAGSPAPDAPSVDPDVAAPPPVATPARSFRHPVPSFDLLYRTFEDRHRGSAEDVRARQSDDYIDLLSSLTSPELPIADLGCGRGELVTLLAGAGQRAVGVDVNTGQLVEEDDGGPAGLASFAEADLFDWLDLQDDASVRAVVAMHVVEHLPLDLQIRLVFEAHRVVVPGGLLVLETPNTLSLSVAATNFWVDPTHQRPVHPLFLEFLAEEAGFSEVATRFLHPIPASFRGAGVVPDLVEDLDSLLLGHGDMALIAGR